ncbi:craniofacial development protein 2-like [Clytia hemisphaerica]|uniref:craniofacial development protein 2-like n=1 Tax=Clytia hemisphaerica TaxID=252671 RepID=UPI0034D69219
MPRNFFTWKIGTINIRTGNSDEKLEKVVEEIDKAGLIICGVQEVRRLNKGSATIAVNNPNNKYEIYWCGNTLKKHHGVGIVVKVAPNIDILEIYQVNSRIIVIDVIVSGCSLRVINCYAPTEESAITTKNLFYRTLKKQIITTNANQKVICLGDFNATTSASLYSSSLRENSVVEDLVINDNGERFHDLFQSYKLSVLNTWFNHNSVVDILGTRQMGTPERYMILFSVVAG